MPLASKGTFEDMAARMEESVLMLVEVLPELLLAPLT